MPPSNRPILGMPEYRKSQVMSKRQLKDLVKRVAASTPERIVVHGKENKNSEEFDNSSFNVESSKLVDRVPNADGDATKMRTGGIEPTPISVNHWMERKRTLDVTGHTSKPEIESICNTATKTVVVKNTTGSTPAQKRKLFVEQLYELSRRHVDGNDQISDVTSMVDSVSQLETDNSSGILEQTKTPKGSYIPPIVSEPTFLVEEDIGRDDSLLCKISEWSTSFECTTNMPSLARYGADCYESLDGSDIDDDDVNLEHVQSLNQSQAMTLTSYERVTDRWNFPSMFRAESIMSALNRSTWSNNFRDSTDRDRPPGIMDTGSFSYKFRESMAQVQDVATDMLDKIGIMDAGSFSYTFRESMAQVQDVATDMLDKIGTWEDDDGSVFGDSTFYFIDDTSYLQSSIGSKTYEDTTIDTRHQLETSFDESAMT